MTEKSAMLKPGDVVIVRRGQQYQAVILLRFHEELGERGEWAGWELTIGGREYLSPGEIAGYVGTVHYGSLLAVKTE